MIGGGDFLDAQPHSTTYQPLIQRTSMGNIKWERHLMDCNGTSRSNVAPQAVLTGTKGLTFLEHTHTHTQPPQHYFVFLNLCML